MVKHTGWFLVAMMAVAGCDDGRTLSGDSSPTAAQLDDRAGQACQEYEAARDCADAVVQYCDADSEGTMEWGPCVDESELECEPGDIRECGDFGTQSCNLTEGEPAWGSCWEDVGGETPLVLVLPGVELAFEPAGTAAFDIAASDDAACLSHDWPTAQTPWLAIDLDGNGSIDDGRELFGSGTMLRSHRRAEHGFAALAELDADGDGIITPADPRFGELLLWADHDGDRRSNHSEHTSLAAAGVLGIPVAFHRQTGCDARGNCGIERTAVAVASGEATVVAEVVDVHLACQ